MAAGGELTTVGAFDARSVASAAFSALASATYSWYALALSADRAWGSTVISVVLSSIVTYFCAPMSGATGNDWPPMVMVADCGGAALAIVAVPETIAVTRVIAPVTRAGVFEALHPRSICCDT
jgi:hypothetical protein